MFISNIDQTVSSILDVRTIPQFGQFFSLLTIMGDTYAWIAGLVLYLIMGKHKKFAMMLLIVLLFGAMINEDLKEIVHRERPGEAFVDIYIKPTSYSFPSGHAQLTFTIATILTAYLSWKYNLITYFFAVAVSVSRVYLGLHYFSDIIAGALAGIIIGEMVVFCLYRYGWSKKPGLIGNFAGINKKTSLQTVADEQIESAAIILALIGIAISGSAMLMSWYAVSLACIVIIYCAFLALPDFYSSD